MFRIKKQKNYSALILTIACLALLGVGSLIISHAATFGTSEEAESGTIAGNAASVANSAASGGNAVRFGVDRSPDKWMLLHSLFDNFNTDDPASAKWFFDSPNAFALGGTASGFAATPVQGYKSYAQFSADITNNAIPSNIRWVQYDIESWSYTPSNESIDPATYLQDFANLAHAHGYKVIETPARDLMSVNGGKCTAQPGESVDAAYIRCRIPADSHYADVYEVQAQADQPNVTTYSDFVQFARSQILGITPNITVMAGLTTDRGDSASQIFSCWQATHALLAGYWMNTQTTSISVAEQVMDQIKAAGG